jgi:hypothetical protein
MDISYNGGRTVTIDSGPVELDASGEEALNIDGYIGFETITDPTALANEKGFIYVKEADGYSELFYMDDYGLATQITKYGELNADEIAAHAVGGSEHTSDTLANFNTKISDATLIDITQLDSYLALDGSDAMAGNLDMGTNNITNVGTVDGYDLPAQFQDIANDDAYQGDQLTLINSDLVTHLDDTANPHSTDIGNLGSGTLSELNSALTDATLIDEGAFDAYAEKTLLDSYATTSHAATHIRAGDDEVDGDKLDIDWNPTNYVPTTDPSEVTSVDELTAHLAGVDGYLATLGNAQNNHIGDEANPHIVTLDQAYDGSGGASGRSIFADNGPVLLMQEEKQQSKLMVILLSMKLVFLRHLLILG